MSERGTFNVGSQDCHQRRAEGWCLGCAINLPRGCDDFQSEAVRTSDSLEFNDRYEPVEVFLVLSEIGSVDTLPGVDLRAFRV